MEAVVYGKVQIGQSLAGSWKQRFMAKFRLVKLDHGSRGLWQSSDRSSMSWIMEAAVYGKVQIGQASDGSWKQSFMAKFR